LTEKLEEKKIPPLHHGGLEMKCYHNCRKTGRLLWIYHTLKNVFKTFEKQQQQNKQKTHKKTK